MKVFTTTFSIESRSLTQGNLKVGAVCNSIPTTVRDMISAYREWHGMQEGANRLELLDPAFRRPRGKRTHAGVNLSLTIALENTIRDEI